MGAISLMAKTLRELATGNLLQRLHKQFIAGLVPLRHDLNDTIAKLWETLQAVTENAGATAPRSREIRASADDLSKRTEQEAASVEEIASPVSGARSRAYDAGELVATTRVNAERSGAIVKNALLAIGETEALSRGISSISGVIDDIAFQTNLLVMNAGGEAARAVETGKGSAGFAQEVRELAQRSAKAAPAISAFINTSGEQDKNEVALVGGPTSLSRRSSGRSRTST